MRYRPLKAVANFGARRWPCSEFEASKAIREYMRKHLNLKREDHLVVSYWRSETNVAPIAGV